MFLLLCAGTEAGKAPCLPCWGSSHRSAAALEQLQIYGLAAAKHRVDEKLCWEVGKEGVICLPSWVQGSSLGSVTMSGQEGSTNPWSSCCLPGRWGWVRVLLTECSQKRLLCFFHILYHLEVVCGGAEMGLKGSQLGAGMCGVSTGTAEFNIPAEKSWGETTPCERKRNTHSVQNPFFQEEMENFHSNQSTDWNSSFTKNQNHLHVCIPSLEFFLTATYWFINKLTCFDSTVKVLR